VTQSVRHVQSAVVELRDRAGFAIAFTEHEGVARIALIGVRSPRWAVYAIIVARREILRKSSARRSTYCLRVLRRTQAEPAGRPGPGIRLIAQRRRERS